MGETKSKEKMEEFEKDGETWRIGERQENVNRLISRMKMKAKEPIVGRKDGENGTEEPRKRSSLRKRDKRKQGKSKWRETNNNNNDSSRRNKNAVNGNGNIEVILDAFVPLKNGELECCEIAAAAEMGPRQNDDVDNANGTIKKKDSIDNIIDLIVSKSIRRDETLHGLIGETNGRRSVRRSRSYHGKESAKNRSPLEEVKNEQNDNSEKSLIERLENLEKRALVFERGVAKMENWVASKENQRSNQRSRCSAASQQFERNMIEVLEENYKDEETLNELKTIERVRPFERIGPKDALIAAPKADPIIRNSIRKIVLRVSKCSTPRQPSLENNAWTWTRETSHKRLVHSKESLLENGWVIVENSAPPIGRTSAKFKSAEKLTEGKSRPRGLGVIANGSDDKSQDKAPVTGGKTYCQMCKKKCSGEVLRVQDKYFHISCFKCKACKSSLAQGGFFCKEGDYYCTSDYQKRFGTKCSHCGEYVEGEVVTALGNTYHQKCFTCGRCRQVFPSGERVTYTGKEVLCQKCVQIPVRDTRSPARSPTGPCECAGCGVELKDGQALIALERQWHIWCFKCKDCDSVLHGEYMGKDGVPYCEKDYQKHFGVKCAYCSRFISGKVLQAGDNHHFHPTCARCSKCGDPFGDGEEMYLQGGAIWHPRCGPGPTENGTILNGSSMLENGHCTDTDGEMSRDTRDFDRMSSSAVSEMQFSLRSRTPSLNGSLGSPCNSLSRKYAYHRTGSPGLILREYKSSQQFPEDISRIYTYSYLTEEPSQGYLKRPIDPYDKPPTSPHFHRPSSSHSQRSGKILIKTGSRSGMKVMAESIRSETPRPKSPHMNNEEPIELARIPDAKKPKPGEKPKIERDDFPAPPYPYTDPERRKRLSGSFKGASDEEEDEIDAKDQELSADDKLKKEEEELSKIATGIGKVFLQNVKEREKLRQYKLQHLDPRNASRVPSANKEPAYRLRYQSPVNASPSRNMDHPRPWEEDDYMDRSSSYRSSVGRSIGAIPSYNANSSSRLGYVRSPGKASTLPTGRYMSGYCSDYGVGYNGDFSYSGFGDKTHSTEFSSGKSDISGGSISEVDRRVLTTDMPMSTTFQGGLRYSSYSPHLRRSLPTLSHMSNEPPKIYPYHLLVITNYRLPVDVDRCNLERHLSDNEFEQRFQCSRAEFYRMPQWRRNDMKRRLKLF